MIMQKNIHKHLMMMLCYAVSPKNLARTYGWRKVKVAMKALDRCKANAWKSYIIL